MVICLKNVTNLQYVTIYNCCILQYTWTTLAAWFINNNAFFSSAAEVSDVSPSVTLGKLKEALLCIPVLEISALCMLVPVHNI